jgi:hypothetical protein
MLFRSATGIPGPARSVAHGLQNGLLRDKAVLVTSIVELVLRVQVGGIIFIGIVVSRSGGSGTSAGAENFGERPAA